MTCLIDMDSTINKFDLAFTTYIKCKGYGFDHAKHDSWDIAKSILGAESYEHQKDIFKMALDDLEFWEHVPPAEHASQVLRYYQYYHDIQIATIPWKMTPAYTGVKMEWLRKHFPFIDPSQVIFSHGNKWDLEGDLIIDDKPEILEKCYGKKITIKPLQPYNKDVPADFTFTDLREIPAILDQCEELLKKEKVS